MILSFDHEVANVTDQYTGIVTTGGVPALLTANPFSTGGRYLQIRQTSSSISYAYRTLSASETLDVQTTGEVWAEFRFRMEADPGNYFDIFSIRSSYAANPMLLLRMMISGVDYFLRAYMRTDSGAQVTLDLPVRTKAWWANEHCIVVGQTKYAGGVQGSAWLYIGDGRIVIDQATSVQTLTNTNLMDGTNRLEVGASNAARYNTTVDYDDVKLASTRGLMAYVGDTPAGSGGWIRTVNQFSHSFRGSFYGWTGGRRVAQAW